MTRDPKREAIRCLLRARRLFALAIENYETGDGLMAEARRLTDEAKVLEAGRWPLPKPVVAVPAHKLH